MLLLRRTVLSLSLTIALASLIACVGTKDRSADKSADKPKESRITLAKFTSIETGMSYKDVCTLLEARGEEQSRVEVGGTSTVLYSWENKGFLDGNMNAMFQDGKLISKAQFGLK